MNDDGDAAPAGSSARELLPEVVLPIEPWVEA